MSIDNAKQLFTTVTDDGKLVLSVEKSTRLNPSH